jgi:hypothetical protein
MERDFSQLIMEELGRILMSIQRKIPKRTWKVTIVSVLAKLKQA